MQVPRSRGASGRSPVLALAAVVVALGFAASLVADYPGHFTPDSVWQLAQGREGVFNDWHPPVMAWLLGVADRMVPGAWPFVVGDAVLFYGALLAFVALEKRPRLFCLPFLVLWMISPVVLLYQGVVLKDVLFADTALAGFAALAWAGRIWTRPPVRNVLLLLALALLSVAGLARQNGSIAALCGAGALAAIIFFQPTPEGMLRGKRLRRAAATGLLGLAAIVLAETGATWVLESHGDHKPQNANHLEFLQAYDLAGIVHRDASAPLRVLDRDGPRLAAFIRVRAAPRYHAVSADNLNALPDRAMMMPPGGALGRQWVQAVLARPLAYLRLRAAVWTNTFLTPSADDCPIFFVGVEDEGAPAMLRRAGLEPRYDDKDDWDNDYGDAFTRTPLFSHAFYAVVLIVAMILGLRRWRRGDRSPALIATLALGLAALLVAASYFVISIACDYRFLYFLDVAAMVAATREAAADSPHASRARFRFGRSIKDKE